MSRNIHIRIDRIVLNGLDIPPSQRDRLKAMIETELTRLFQDRPSRNQSLNPSLSHQHTPTRPLEITLTSRSDLLSVGQQISQMIYEHIFA